MAKKHQVKAIAIIFLVLCFFCTGTVQARTRLYQRIVSTDLFQKIVGSQSPDEGTEVMKLTGGSPWFPFPGDFFLTPALPDKCSRYDAFSFKPESGDFDYVKVTGQLPFARYFSFNLYNFREGSPLFGPEEKPGELPEGQFTNAIADFELKLDNDCGNPFKEGDGVDRDTPDRGYTLYIVKNGCPVPEQAENYVVLPPTPADPETGKPFIVALVTRMYRPDQAYEESGAYQLPRIRAYKNDGTAAMIPQFGLTLESAWDVQDKIILAEDLLKTHEKIREIIEGSGAPDQVMFHRYDSSGLFPNDHNRYIAAAMPVNYANTVLRLTFTPPSSETLTYSGGPFTFDTRVRYWSVCVGGMGMTRTPDCLCDDEAKENSDTSVTIIVAPLYLKEAIESKGLNFIRWGLVYKPIVLHRQMLADQDWDDSISNLETIPRFNEKNAHLWDLDFLEEKEASGKLESYGFDAEMYDIQGFVNWLDSFQGQ